MPTRAVNIRVDEELYQYLQDRAEKENRSVSNMIISILSDSNKVGHWLPYKYAENPDKFKKCSNCNTAIDQYVDVYKPDGTYRGRLYNKIFYCPICGVKMESEG